MEPEKIQLQGQEVSVVRCKQCGLKMVNIDADELKKGDLAILKRAKVSISNPETEDPICINCEYRSFGRRLADWFESEGDDDDSFFSGGSFGGSSSSGGFGGFGGFGGGGFGGGGAARGF